MHPPPAAGGISRQPIFQWNAVAGADGYELVVGTDAAFVTPAVSRSGEYAIPGTAWESNVPLEYGSTYYWKVPGVSAASMSAWSNVSAFRTEEKPVATPTQPAATLTAVTKGDIKLAPDTVEKQTIEVTPVWAYYVMGGEFVVIIALMALVFLIVGRSYY